MSNKKTIFHGSGRLGAQGGATTILLAFFIMNILLLISLTAASIMIFDIRMSAEIANSVPAFYAADAGSEWCLYQVRKLDPNSGDDCTTVGATAIQVEMDNGASGEAGLTTINQINAFGVFGGTQRQIELSWAESPTPTPTPAPTPAPTPTPTPLSATGGTITYSGGYTIHTFTSNGTLIVTGSGNVEYLVVAGGGSGAQGGGGGGGYIYNSDFAISAGDIAVIVGASTPPGIEYGITGKDSSFGTYIAKGGGAGGQGGNGGAGASGGGGGAQSSNTYGGAATPAGQGNTGGGNNGYISDPYPAGGGGGAGAVGGSASGSSIAGNGGAGLNNDISGVSVGYAGGGGGGLWSSGTPGTASHGGGAGAVGASGVSGTANTGGGGGGAKGSSGYYGGAGGSGVVIVRYLNSTSPPPAQSNPSNLVLSHSTRLKSFSVSWTAGTNNGGAGGCKLQFYTGSTWTDISSATNVNCDADSSSAAYNLNADGWKASWDGTEIRILRISDSAAMGMFGTTLACASTSGSSSSTPTIDEDCNGYWDNSTSTGCNWGCTEGGKLVNIKEYSVPACGGGLFQDSNCCSCGVENWPMDTCLSEWVNPGWYTYLTMVDANCCSYGWLSTCYTYY